MKRTSVRRPFTLGELIPALYSSARNKREAIAAVAEILGSGRVSLQGQSVRFRVTQGAA